MSHLKLNTLHIGLYNDELCGYKFKTIKAGHNNPFAIDASDLKEIIKYAREYSVSVIPELQSWGHSESIIMGHPETYGCPGMWGGSSFGIGEKTYSLLEKIYSEIIPLLEDKATLHVGLDEAMWQVLEGEEDKGHTTENMVARIYSITQKVAKENGKEIDVHLWADHGGRPIPKDIEDKLVVMPWKYRQSDKSEIEKNVEKYGNAKTPFIMGAGWSSIHFQGSYEATKIWAQEGTKYKNAIGITNCMWDSNDLASQMVGLYGGANFSWSPFSFTPKDNDPIGEDVRCWMINRMRKWQALFRHADPKELRKDMGEEVLGGRYVWYPKSGESVSPTVDFNGKE